MNKKGQAQIYAFLVMAVIIIGIITYNLGYKKGNSETESLLQELDSQKIYSQQLERQLEERDIEMDNTLGELNNCIGNLENRSNELSECQDSTGLFPLFWEFTIHLTKEWINVINIYFIISIPLSLIGIRVIIKRNRRRR